MMTPHKSMNNEHESDETKHLGDPEEVAQRWEKITKILELLDIFPGCSLVFQSLLYRYLLTRRASSFQTR